MHEVALTSELKYQKDALNRARTLSSLYKRWRQWSIEVKLEHELVAGFLNVHLATREFW